jgi:hypothetical protein
MSSFHKMYRHYKRYDLPVQLSIRSNAVWCVSYPLLWRSWLTNSDNRLLHLSELEIFPVDKGCLFLL